MKLAKAKNSYSTHRYNADKRNIPFLISFNEWYNWWLSNGVDKNQPASPKSKNTLCMCRFGDQGAYELNNIYCDTVSNNVKLQRTHHDPKPNLTKPIMTPDGSFQSRKEAAQFYGITGSSLGCRMKRHPTEYYYL